MREARAPSVAREPAAPHRDGPRPAEPHHRERAAEAVVEPGAAARPAPVGPVEEIAQAYLATTHGDAGIALRCAITDALSDLLEAERRARENSRLISRGYVRDWSGRG